MFSRVTLALLLAITVPYGGIVWPQAARAQAPLPRPTLVPAAPEAVSCEGVSMVPARAIAEALDATITRNAEVFTITRQGKTLAYRSQKTTALANGNNLKLPAAPNDYVPYTSYLPLLPLVRTLGGAVLFNNTAKTLLVTLPGQPEPLVLRLVPEKPAYERSASELYSLNLDGSGMRRLTFNASKESPIAISPDGIFCTYTVDNNIIIRPCKSAWERVLVPQEADVNYDAPSFTPDGKQVIYTRWKSIADMEPEYDYDEDTDRGQHGKCDIFAVNLDGAGKQWLAEGYNPVMRPDYSAIAYMAPPWDNDNARPVVNIKSRDGSNTLCIGEGRNPVFNATGSTVLFAQPHPISWEEDAVQYRITSYELSAQEQSLFTPAAKAPIDQPYPHKARMRSHAELTDDDAVCGRFSADGTRIVYENLGISLLNADHTGWQPVSVNPDDHQPTLTPDGKSVLVLRGDEGQYDSMDYYLYSCMFGIRTNYPRLLKLDIDGIALTDMAPGFKVNQYALLPSIRQIIVTGEKMVTHEDVTDEDVDLREGPLEITTEQLQAYAREVIPVVEKVMGRKFITTPTCLVMRREESAHALSRSTYRNYLQYYPEKQVNQDDKRQLYQSTAMNQISLGGFYTIDEKCIGILTGNIAMSRKLKHLENVDVPSYIKTLLAHELTHALEYQIVPDSPAAVARRTQEADRSRDAVIEGMANIAMEQVAAELHLETSLEQLETDVEREASFPFGMSADPFTAITRQRQRDVYDDGFRFCTWHYRQGGMEHLWKILQSPPTRAQIIWHPDRYTAHVAPAINYTTVTDPLQQTLREQGCKVKSEEISAYMLRSMLSDMKERNQEIFFDNFVQARFLGAEKHQAHFAASIWTITDPRAMAMIERKLKREQENMEKHLRYSEDEEESAKPVTLVPPEDEAQPAGMPMEIIATSLTQNRYGEESLIVTARIKRGNDFIDLRVSQPESEETIFPVTYTQLREMATGLFTQLDAVRKDAEK